MLQLFIHMLLTIVNFGLSCPISTVAQDYSTEHCTNTNITLIHSKISQIYYRKSKITNASPNSKISNTKYNKRNTYQNLFSFIMPVWFLGIMFLTEKVRHLPSVRPKSGVVAVSQVGRVDLLFIDTVHYVCSSCRAC